MSHVTHELHEEFSADTQPLHELKLSNPHFARLADNYQAVNHEIHRSEAGIDAVNDAALEDMKKLRLNLKDEIATLLVKA
jgi:uncharacterized protein YdcH (DUF465 family)